MDLAQTDRWASLTLRRLLSTGAIHVPSGMEREDLLALARSAAWAASQEHDPSRGALRTWVIQRASWAIREACRMSRYGGARPGVIRLRTVPLEDLTRDEARRYDLPDPRNAYHAADARLIVAKAERRLSLRAWAILWGYYGLDETAMAMAPRHGLSPGRIALLARQAKDEAREALAGLDV